MDNEGKNLPQSIKKIANVIENHYINGAKGKKIAKEIEKFLKSTIWERYKDGADMNGLRRHLNSIIWSIADDGHFTIAAKGAAPAARSHIVRYTPNYIKIARFAELSDPQVRADYRAAFAGFKSPLIVDLRDCVGGAPETAYYLLSHFFPAGKHLFDLENKRQKKKLVAKADFPFYTDKLQVRPFKGEVKIVINSATASAAELVAFVIKKNKRGKIYGAKSPGHAHVMCNHEIGPFITHVPFAQISIDGKTWEGKGVDPDYDSTSTEYVDLLYNDIAFNYLS